MMFYDYHDNMGHNTEECRALKWFVIKHIKKAIRRNPPPKQNTVPVALEMLANTINL